MQPNAPLAAGSKFAGRFKILQTLGTGKTGTTYSAERLPSREACALKVMRAGLLANAPLRAAFRAEAMSVSIAKNKHIVKVLDAGIDETTGRPWLASELLTGMDLAARIRLWGRVPEAEVGPLVTAIGDALATAAAVGLVHYDLSPVCVHLLQGEDPSVKLRELGLSRFMAQACLASGDPIVSPLWMAPEQLTPGPPPIPTANVWSVGLIAFYALTGRSYWTRSETEGKALLREVVSDNLVPASVRAKALGRGDVIPAWFDAWFARCTARSPRARFYDARAAAARWGRVDSLVMADDDDRRMTLPFVPKPAFEAKPALEPSPTPPLTAALPSSGAVRKSRVLVRAAALSLLVGGAFAVFWSSRAVGPDDSDHPRAPSPSPAALGSSLTSARSATADQAATLPASSPDSSPSRETDAEGAGLAEYDLDTALKALNKVYYGGCDVPARGKMLIQFAPDGRVKQVKVDEGDYDEATSTCLMARFRTATMPPFRGGPHYVTATVLATH
jgi:serine/threonine protein kinase